jgi:hypothetical protein
MAENQQYNSQARGIPAPFAVIAGMGRKVQAIASEITELSQQNIDAGAKAVQKLREVKSLPEVIDIHTDLVKTTFENLSAHYPRIAEIAAATPVELIESYQEAFGKIAEQGGAAVQKAVDASSALTEKTTAAVRDVTEQTTEAARQATDKTAEAVRSTTR